MKIGFYAPLKSPNHPVASGDRAMAGLLIKALTSCGHEVEILSELRSWEGKGVQSAQEKTIASAQKEVERLTNYYQTNRPPELIFVYHVYHKAPDWIGVELANRLHVPYLIAEASFAPKQVHGRWRIGHQQTLKCIRTAQTIIAFNPMDVECLKPLLKSSQSIELLSPFLDERPAQPYHVSALTKPALRKQFAERYHLDSNKVWLITVAMMRAGDKSTSYKQLAETLSQIDMDLWQWVAIGGGENFDQIQNFFKPLAANCFFMGELGRESIHQWLVVGDIFAWPAVNEAYGLALLEALAAGLPAVVQNYGGVSSIVEHNRTGYVTNPDNRNEFTQSLAKLIRDENRRKNMAAAAIKKFISKHSYPTAVSNINAICNHVGCNGAPD
ncbi:glycosyltransferase family 4 protein [Candidatus Spongiihabitans sp.]|uniref:glycosyltransferase family 4 protein n=1 Tax=Candidatus Spongiihabitans sp. TaxID=3101308 RepID=UPI003C7AF84C